MRERDAAARIGLIAGHGRLPAEAARALHRAGAVVAAVGLEGVCDPALSDAVDSLAWQRLGQLDAVAEALRGFGVARVLLVGGVPKARLFEAGLDLDATARTLLASLRGWDDASLFRALAGWLAGEGFEVLRQDLVLAGLTSPEGTLSTRAPTASERSDVAFGRATLAQIAAAGIGQCVVVRRGCVVAVEASEGTDETIRRAGRLAGAGTVVVKAVRPDQDRRFDLPVIGPETLRCAAEAGAAVVAIEARTTLVLEREEVVRLADAAGIALVVMPGLASPPQASS